MGIAIYDKDRQLVVSHNNGHVVVKIGDNTLRLDPDSAKLVAQCITHCADEAFAFAMEECARFKELSDAMNNDMFPYDDHHHDMKGV